MQCVKGIAVRTAAVAVAWQALAGVSGLSAESETFLPSTAAPSPRVLVFVDDEPITEGDLRFMMLSRRVSEEAGADVRRELLEQLIDRRLMQSYLSSRKADPDPKQIDVRVERIRALIRKRGDDPHKVLASLGYTDERLRDELALPLAWRTHFHRMIAAEQVRDYFQNHREQFDGTRVRASQIFLKAGTESERAEAIEKLDGIRKQIVTNQVTFAEAAMTHSEAPSGKQGGDVGFFPYRGRMPVAFSAQAFSLEKGEISRPFVTRFGVHLCTVTDRRPGQLSLEDARDQVLRRLSEQKWQEQVAELRSRARIEWQVDAP